MATFLDWLKYLKARPARSKVDSEIVGLATVQSHMQDFLSRPKSTGSKVLLTWVFFEISKFFLQFFVRNVHRCYVQFFVCIGQTAYEEFETGDVPHFITFELCWIWTFFAHCSVRDSTEMLCAIFGANRWNCLGGVWKSMFATFCAFAKKW